MKLRQKSTTLLNAMKFNMINLQFHVTTCWLNRTKTNYKTCTNETQIYKQDETEMHNAHNSLRYIQALLNNLTNLVIYITVLLTLVILMLNQ